MQVNISLSLALSETPDLISFFLPNVISNH